jgi:hypothetical protein
MTLRAGRFLPALILGVLVAATGVLLFGYAGRTPPPGSTSAVAAATSEPRPVATKLATARTTPEPPTIEPSRAPEPSASDAASPDPSSPEPSSPAPSQAPEPARFGLGPGSVDRTSLNLDATYDVNAEIRVGTGVLDVSTTIVVRNAGTKSIDRLELNTVAARLGRIRITHASVDGEPVKARINDQTLMVPLGGVLEPGFITSVQIAYRATLRTGVADSDWMFTRSNGTITLYRWIPWISRAVPFDRPNQGDPFVTASSREVSVELLTDLPLYLASPAADVAEFAAGSGGAWAFTLHDVRDVALVLAPDFAVRQDKVGGVTVRAYSRGGDFAAQRLLDLTTTALSAEKGVLGADYPGSVLVAVETEGGEAMESPGLILVPRTLDTLNRTYLVHHAVAHQWFYGLVGNDQRNDPFLDEAAADFLARTALGNFRPTRCGLAPLDQSIARYEGRCYYEVVYVQGGLLLDEVRLRIGTNRFWKALAGFLEDHRNELVRTRQLLDALEDAAPDGSNLRPLFRARFPSLY